MSLGLEAHTHVRLCETVEEEFSDAEGVLGWLLRWGSGIGPSPDGRGGARLHRGSPASWPAQQRRRSVSFVFRHALRLTELDEQVLVDPTKGAWHSLSDNCHA